MSAYLAFPILLLASSVVSPMFFTTLPRCTIVLSSSTSFQLICTLHCCVLFPFRSFVFCVFILRLVFSAFCVKQLVFFCICLCRCDCRQLSSAKSRSFNCLVNVHWMPFWPCLAVYLIMQSINMIPINVDVLCLSLLQMAQTEFS